MASAGSASVTSDQTLAYRPAAWLAYLSGRGPASSFFEFLSTIRYSRCNGASACWRCRTPPKNCRNAAILRTDQSPPEHGPRHCPEAEIGPASAANHRDPDKDNCSPEMPRPARRIRKLLLSSLGYRRTRECSRRAELPIVSRVCRHACGRRRRGWMRRRDGLHRLAGHPECCSTRPRPGCSNTRRRSIEAGFSILALVVTQ